MQKVAERIVGFRTVDSFYNTNYIFNNNNNII